MTTAENGFDNQHTVSEELGFEAAFRQLTEIAEKLEAGGLTLAESTAWYEEGMRLVQLCNRLLDTAELDVQTMRESHSRPPVASAGAIHEESALFDDDTSED